mgnify:CR=1 FL=1
MLGLDGRKKLMLNTTSVLALTLIAGSVFIQKDTQETSQPIPIAVEPYVPSWKCPDCTPEEQYVLEQLQEKTKIKDKNALATILGNIKQESRFVANVCEGGSRVPYTDCHRGGYGLIQWTSTHRYLGLGAFAEKYECNPSELKCQTRYMINEDIFQRILPDFEGGGQTVSQYMIPAYYWLGWGIKGKRETYAYDYTTKLIFS